MSMVQDNQCSRCGEERGPFQGGFIDIDDAVICDNCIAEQKTLKPPVKVQPEDGFHVDDAQRLRITVALNRWLRECESTGDDAWQAGSNGYIGTFKLSAYTEDAGLMFRVERSFEDPL